MHPNKETLNEDHLIVLMTLSIYILILFPECFLHISWLIFRNRQGATHFDIKTGNWGVFRGVERSCLGLGWKTQYRRLGGLSMTQTYFSVLGGWGSAVRVTTQLGSGEAADWGLSTVSPGGRERGSELSRVPFVRTRFPSSGLYLWDLINPQRLTPWGHHMEARMPAN